MVEETATNENDEPMGGSGGDSLRPQGRADTALIERAIRERWPIPDEYRDALVNRQVRIAVDPQVSPREATSAFRSLVQAERQNLEADKIALEVAGITKGEHVVEHVGQVDVVHVLQEIEGDERFEEFARQSLGSAHAGNVGHNGKQGTLAVGEAPNGRGPSGNGHGSPPNGK